MHIPEGYAIEEIAGQAPVLRRKVPAKIEVTKITRIQLFDLLGDKIALEILTAAKTDPVVELLYEKTKAADTISLSDESFIKYLDVLVEHDEISLTAGGKEQLLRGFPVDG